mmetsp:Transcript_23567/g.58424  ORF Transcript_23567/g.58424 Transcript_23567/m.58424 type:complete len:331 (+) Transcript_23567:320-1312(+)
MAVVVTRGWGHAWSKHSASRVTAERRTVWGGRPSRLHSPIARGGGTRKCSLIKPVMCARATECVFGDRSLTVCKTSKRAARVVASEPTWLADLAAREDRGVSTARSTKRIKAPAAATARRPSYLVLSYAESARQRLLGNNLLDDGLDFVLCLLDAALRRALYEQEQPPLPRWHALARSVVLPLGGDGGAGELGDLIQRVFVCHFPARVLREVVHLQLRLEVRGLVLVALHGGHGAPARGVLRVERRGEGGGARGARGRTCLHRHVCRQRDGAGGRATAARHQSQPHGTAARAHARHRGCRSRGRQVCWRRVAELAGELAGSGARRRRKHR